ncbi:unnamed protein product [Menidia menidia]|uniref:(Atlantic silverside) hypothetical protein n=1 Tax=Menidia menidia TaxID=238744 RepID=A0A8S4BHY3_9TELE|nr:unnamed protein product [Menidia menidia]
MEVSHKSAPPSVKRWQLDGTDHGPPHLRSGALLSSWTPLNHKQSNRKLFEERVNLVLHWFDLWTDVQRKHLLHSLLTRSTKSQLKYCRDLLTGTVPVTRADFAVLLPRFLTLYVMSHLSPLDLCRAAQVSWQWRVLAEQDCLWIGRCVRRGWFLPYTPREKEFGAWKNHYVTCVSSMNLPPPREASIPYGGLDQPQSRRWTEEEEERRTERRIREKTREKLQEMKRLAMRSRGPWGSNPKANRARGGSKQTERTGLGITFGSLPSLSWPPRTTVSSILGLNLDREPAHSLDREPAQGLDRVQASSVSRFSQPDRASSCDYPPPALLMLLSNKIPAYELVLSGLKAGVIVVLYDCRGTLSALLSRVERATLGKQIQRIGILAPGGTEEIRLLNESTVLTPDHREFWEKLAGRVAPTEEGGGMDVFCPLAASASGVTLIRALSALTGLEVRAPVGLDTGSFQSILGEWSDAELSEQHQQQGGPAGAPARLYVWDAALQGWCRQALWMEEALRELRSSLEPRLWPLASLQARGRALGFCLWERISLDKLDVSKELGDALTEGLTALCGQEEETRPVEFLASFLMKWSQNKEEGDNNDPDKPQNAAGDEASSAKLISGLYGSVPELPQTALDWRGEVVRELHKSERDYLGRLSALLKVYHEPIKAALDSNRAILSYADIQIIFSPVAQILNLNRTFEADLVTRLEQWSADQCVGDVFLKLSSKLRVYSNYLNNYATALKTVDKCRDTKPKFRAFLKMADRTLATQMLSLQELLLSPVWRIQEYVTLLQALSLHTPPHHPDRAHLRSALDTMSQFRRSEADRLIEETQQQIQGCPSLREGNRQLIITQDVELLRSPDEQVPDCLRTYERVSDVGLFLFSDALVVTLKNTRHTPFTLSHRSTHTFLASVALTCLTVREIVHSQYVRHAFVLEGPVRSWACSTDRGEDKAEFLSALRAAISSALTEHE